MTTDDLPTDTPVSKRIREFLKHAGVPFDMYEHEDTPTSEAAASMRAKLTGKTPEEVLKHGAKAMIVRTEGTFVQFVIPGNKKIDWKKAKAILKSKSVSLATPDEVFKVTGVQIGGVPPFGNLFGLKVYLEKSMLDNDHLDCNAGSRGISLTMSVQDYVKSVKPELADFAAS